ncbi:hypothetical protein CkaCkLH20_05865 [Colletotrichum karsti]|uniref:Uncharacterized protein n=1 Tax=Colletotrichum karsti TaxID=1095194 RepID=A0A9P6I654_9PEZI|nr:uncharacterized protein CkaCkLH20_05865 [Colletotrichum karsti]KAF9876457.1 hypothetical protein CkaCkLH20_05865 [Colletotrichum karsti]
MGNFHSEAILKDRLTLQPAITAGLFQNGRVSSPKPVEELAYNSLATLENPPPRLPSRQQHNRVFRTQRRAT